MELETQDFGLEWTLPKPDSNLMGLHITTPWTQEQLEAMCAQDIGGWRLAEVVFRHLLVELEKRNAECISKTAEVHGVRAE